MRAGDVIAERYRLDRLLGEGGMGAVWAATHLVTGRGHALKLLRKEADEGTRRRMLREARAASAVRHPNVVAVHDVLEAPDGGPVLVMDLLEGESLGARLARERKLEPEEVRRVGVAVLDALAAAHGAGIVHRDLKPDNVFLVAGDGAPEVKILDFGVAKLTASEGLARETNLLTESGAMLGTPCYMAPEQAFGEGAIDARTDLWAVGALLYECLAGTRPVDGANLGQVMKVLATGAIVPLAERAPEVPPEMALLVDRLLAIDPAGRPASAAEARAALEGAAPGAARGDAATADGGPRRRPARGGRVAIVGVLAAAVAGLVAASARSPSAPAGARATPEAPTPEATAAPPVVEAPAKLTTPAPASAPEPPPSVTAARMRPPSRDAGSAPSRPPRSDSKLLTDPPF